jgi:hypothetical protein
VVCTVICDQCFEHTGGIDHAGTDMSAASTADCYGGLRSFERQRHRRAASGYICWGRQIAIY